jgi:hypothetical protein
MTSRSHRWLSAAALLLASGTVGLAQDATRSWVDPPSSVAPADETVTYPEAPPSPPRNELLQAKARETDAEAPPVAAASPAPVSAAPTPGPRSRPLQSRGGVQKAAEAGKIQRKASAKATVASAARSPAKASARRDVVATGALPIAPRVERRFSEAAPGYRRIRSVREALDAGLTVTRVRTFELPDGRRIEVESEPDPRTSLDLVVRPY